jgi:integrase
MPRSNKPVYSYLFENPDLKRWYDNLARGSEITADVYLRRLGAFCGKHNTSPAELASMNPKRIEQIILDHVTEVEKKFTGGYIKCQIKGVKSWLTFNDVLISRNIRIRHTDDAQSRQVMEERVPTKEELRRILLSATKQSRVAIALMAYSGLRPESLGNYQGSDGLKLADLPDLEIAIL